MFYVGSGVDIAILIQYGLGSQVEKVFKDKEDINCVAYYWNLKTTGPGNMEVTGDPKETNFESDRI